MSGEPIGGGLALPISDVVACAAGVWPWLKEMRSLRELEAAKGAELALPISDVVACAAGVWPWLKEMQSLRELEAAKGAD